MSSILDELGTKVNAWAANAVDSGWLNDHEISHLQQPRNKTPASLFNSLERPLVVAFFGGTGVGKSTLLNRLAGEAIARTSAERPTSREITLYAHRSTTIDHLPSEFPIEKINQAKHDNEKHKSVLWIDMPDFDSAETANRDLVADWLPHIDLLVYVVSPERYRDDQGWRLLLQHGQRHAWVFVINHWDRGNPEQRHAFLDVLKETGLEQPLLFCTDCGPDNEKPNGDEFSEFDAAIQGMASSLIIRQLEERGVLVRIQDTRSEVEVATQQFGNDGALATLLTGWQQQWSEHSAELNSSLNWKYKQLAQPFAEHDKGFFSSVLDILKRKPPQSSQIGLPVIDSNSVLDEAARTRIEIGLDQLAQDASPVGIPVQAVRRATESVREKLDQTISNSVETQLQQSLALPGTDGQRKICKILGILATVLPLLAIGWAVYQLISVYSQGPTQQGYLGFNFATHSLMLAGFGWFIPWFLKQRLRPTLQAAAERGMRTGVETAMSDIAKEIGKEVGALEEERTQLISESRQLFNEIPGLPTIATESNQDTAEAQSRLSRVLLPESTIA